MPRSCSDSRGMRCECRLAQMQASRAAYREKLLASCEWAHPQGLAQLVLLRDASERHKRCHRAPHRGDASSEVLLRVGEKAVLVCWAPDVANLHEDAN
jgi:hypothetical protein